MTPPSDVDTLGGEERLRAVVEVFVDRVFSDPIIGFFFEGRDRARIAQHEFELAAAHLGSRRRYAGRPIPAVHQPLRINRGQFRRRLAILRSTLRDQGVPDGIADRWIEHDSKLESAVTIDRDCLPDSGYNHDE